MAWPRYPHCPLLRPIYMVQRRCHAAPGGWRREKRAERATLITEEARPESGWWKSRQLDPRRCMIIVYITTCIQVCSTQTEKPDSAGLTSTLRVDGSPCKFSSQCIWTVNLRSISDLNLHCLYHICARVASCELVESSCLPIRTHS